MQLTKRNRNKYNPHQKQERMVHKPRPVREIFFRAHLKKRFWLFNLKFFFDSCFEKLLIYDHLKYLVCEVWFGKFF